MHFIHSIQIPIVRLLLLIVASVAALWLGFFSLGGEQAVQFVGRWGYWFVAVPFFLLCWETGHHIFESVFRMGPRQDPVRSALVRSVVRRAAAPIAFVFFVSIVLLASQPIAFKVTMDEPVIVATSMQMHEEKHAFAAVQMYEVEGTRFGISQIVDKRPLFFPFVMSLMHDFTGYRPSQGFYLNGLLLVGVLGLVFCFGRRLCPPYGGYLAVGLLATMPLLAVNATSSGFDLLNLFMILTLGLCLEAYLHRPSDQRLNLLLLLAVLLAQTRYESVLFVVPVAWAVFFVWLREREIRITKTMIAVPTMLIAYALQRGIMNEYEGFWQLPQGVESPFGLRFVGENLRLALEFFFSPSQEYANSLLLTICFLIAAAVAPWLMLRRSALARRTDTLTPWLGLGAVAGINFLLLMAYHWGRLNDPVASRLALPIIFVQLFFVIYILGRTAAGRRWQIAFGACVLAYFMFISRPVYARTDFFEWSIRNTQCDYLLDLCAEMETGETNLIISELGVVAGIGQTSSLLTQTALQEPGKLEFHRRMRSFDQIYVAYLLRTDEPHDAAALEKRFEMETLDEIKINNAIYMRVARLEKVHLDAGEHYGIDLAGLEMTDEGELSHPYKDLAEALTESLPK